MADAPETPSPPLPDAVPASPGLSLGDWVRLNRSVPYLKTADPMPMLRPPDLVDPGETGQVVGLRAGQLAAVRYRRGTFLLEREALVFVSEPG